MARRLWADCALNATAETHKAIVVDSPTSADIIVSAQFKGTCRTLGAVSDCQAVRQICSPAVIVKSNVEHAHCFTVPRVADISESESGSM